MRDQDNSPNARTRPWTKGEIIMRLAIPTVLLVASYLWARWVVNTPAEEAAQSPFFPVLLGVAMLLPLVAIAVLFLNVYVLLFCHPKLSDKK